MATKNEFISDKTVFDTLGKGWNLAFSGFGPLLVVAIILVFANAVPDQFNQYLGLAGIIIGLLLAFFVMAPIQMGGAWVYLKAARKEKYRIGDTFVLFKRNYWDAVGASFLTFLFIILGLIVFVIPGIIIAIRLAFVNYLVADKKMAPMEAIKKSWAMTKGYSWRIFWLYILSIIIVIIGLILLIVGVFISTMWIASTFAVLFNSIDSKKK